jgi:hypothetical protein
MDARQIALLRVAFHEAYLCLRDRNRPQVIVEGRMVHSDAELAAAIRWFAQRMVSFEVEHERLVSEVQPLWEAQISGTLARLLDMAEQLHELDVGGERESSYTPAAGLHELDLQLLRVLARVPEETPLSVA